MPSFGGSCIVRRLSISRSPRGADGGGFFHPSRGAILTVIICATIGVLVSTVAIFAVWSARQHAFREHQRDATNLAVGRAEQTARYVETVDMTSKDVKSWATDSDLRNRAAFKSRMQSADVHQSLLERRANFPMSPVIGIVGADGEVLNSSEPDFAAGLTVADRDYYQYLKSHNDPAIFVGSPGRGSIPGRPGLFFARRVNSPDGTCLGGISGMVDAAYLRDFYRSISDRLQGAVALVSRDGTILVRYPERASAVGQKMPLTMARYSGVADGDGHYQSHRVLDGVASVVVAQPLRDYPLVVHVIVPESVILASWRHQAIYVAIGALAVALGFIVLTCVIARQFQRQRQQNNSLKQDAANLLDSEQKLRRFAEMSSDWFWEQGPDLRFVRDAMIPLTSLPTDVGKTRWEFADPAMNPQRWDLHNADLAARRPFRDFRWERIRTDGKRRYMSTSGDPIFDDSGAFLGYQGTGRDITADVEAAEDLRLAKERAEAANHAKSAFLTNMSHELRTPLNAIIGFSELIRDQKSGRSDNNHVEWADAVVSSGRHLMGLINNVLELARIEAGHYDLADNKVTLSAVARGCIVMVRLQAERSRVRIECALADTDAVLRADDRAVKQVVLNLLANAVKFTPAGGVVSIHIERPSNGDVVLVVSDTGIGIDPSALPLLCEPFIQADASMTRRHEGTGLGLAISRKLMGLHGGRLTIESAPGQGTTVRATFPAVRVLARQKVGPAAVAVSI